MRLDARTHIALTMAVTAAAVATAFLMPVPAFAGDFLQGSGHEASVTRTVPAFTGLRVEGPVDVHARAGAAGQVVVHADDNLLSQVETVMDGSTLVVRLVPHTSFQTHHDLRVDVPIVPLQSLQVRGSGDVTLDDLQSPRFEASVTGSGDVTVQRAAVGALVAEISGSGDMRFAGRADSARFAIHGSGDVRARELQARQVEVTISGSGDAEVQATDSLTASVAGSGNVRYAGHPQKVDRRVAGSGDIDPI